MRNTSVSIAALVACVLLSACAGPDSNSARANAYSQDRVTTGSNIPHKGQAVVVDSNTVQDQINRGAGSGSSR